MAWIASVPPSRRAASASLSSAICPLSSVRANADELVGTGTVMGQSCSPDRGAPTTPARTLSDILHATARAHGDALAIDDGSVTLTYAELALAVAAKAAELSTVAVLSATPEHAKSGTSWLGSPPVRLRRAPTAARSSTCADAERSRPQLRRGSPSRARSSAVGDGARSSTGAVRAQPTATRCGRRFSATSCGAGGCGVAGSSPGCACVVLQEAAVQVLAGLTAHDRVVHPGRAVDQVEGRVKPLLGEPHLGRVRPLVGDPARVDAGHEDAVLGELGRARPGEHVERSFGHVRVRVARTLVAAAEDTLHRRDVDDVSPPPARCGHGPA